MVITTELYLSVFALYLKSLVAKRVRSTLDHSEKIKFLLFLPHSNIVINKFFLAIFFSLYDGNFNFSLVSSYRATKNQYIKTIKSSLMKNGSNLFCKPSSSFEIQID